MLPTPSHPTPSRVRTATPSRRLRSTPTTLVLCLTLFCANAPAGTYGFADRPGGGVRDPRIDLAASIAPNLGATFSRTEAEANPTYNFDAASSTFQLAQPSPVIPAVAGASNQFIRIAFPFDLRTSAVKSLADADPSLAATSFLTANLSITDENGAHVPGIAVFDGRDVFGTNLSANPSFPAWLDSTGQNQLVGDNVLTYIADDGDHVLGTTAAFGGTAANPAVSPIKEIHVRLHQVDGVIVNGHWVVKIGDAAGAPVTGQPPLSVVEISALSPVVPPQLQGGDLVVQPFTSYLVRYSEPVVPLSVGFSAAYVKWINASAPVFPLLFNGNLSAVPNNDPSHLPFPFYPNFRVDVDPGGTPFPMPFDVRPINPNNLSEYLVTPMVDLPSDLKVTLTSIAATDNLNQSTAGAPQTSAVTSFYNVLLDLPPAASSESFYSGPGAAIVNAPVSPQAMYFTTLDGGVGGVNLDGNGFETNDPATTRLQLLTSNFIMCQCPVALPLAGSHLLGCNGNAFGDPSGLAPTGIAGNPAGTHLGPPTPYPGVNEGSVGSTASQGSPNFLPPGFETLIRDSNGAARLAPSITGATDIQVGGFLDVLFFDTQSLGALMVNHTSFVTGTPVLSNTISDPPVPNPPPLRLPVGLPPIAVLQSSHPSLPGTYVIEGSEVFTAGVGCSQVDEAPVHLLPNPVNPLGGDVLTPFAQNGPMWQSFQLAAPYAARQQIGNFLYVADRDSGAVEVLNSNRFTRVDRIETLDPSSLAVSPDLKRLYVTNESRGTLSVIGIDPFSPNFHKVIQIIPVGRGPRAVAVQPDNEDVFVCNYRDDSVTIIDVASLTVRKTITLGIDGPWDIVLSPRHIQTGFGSGLYFGFILSRENGRVLVYESGPSAIGADDIRWEVDGPFRSLGGIVYDPATYPGSSTSLPGGCYFTHMERDTGEPLVSRVAWTQEVTTATGVRRAFEVVGQWGGVAAPLNPGGQSRAAFDIALDDYSVTAFFDPASTAVQTNLGALPSPSPQAGGINSKSPLRMQSGAVVPTWVPDRMYVSFPEDGVIEVLDPVSPGVKKNTIQGVPRGAKLATYFDG